MEGRKILIKDKKWINKYFILVLKMIRVVTKQFLICIFCPNSRSKCFFVLVITVTIPIISGHDVNLV